MDLNGNQVIAVDFDGTLCKQAWPEIGEENEILIEHLKEQQAAGARCSYGQTEKATFWKKRWSGARPAA